MSHHFEILRKEAAYPENTLRSKKRSLAHASPWHNPARPSTEFEIANLVSALFLSRVRTVMFSPTEDSARSDWVCARVAELLAIQTARKICIVDAKLHAPSLHKQFAQRLSFGLLDAIKSPQRVSEFVKPTWITNLFRLDTGETSPRALMSFDPIALGSVFQRLREEFDHVLVVGPSLGMHADAVCIGSLTDGTVLILTANETRREAARVAAERLNAAKIRILGVVLDRRAYPIPERIYKRL